MGVSPMDSRAGLTSGTLVPRFGNKPVRVGFSNFRQKVHHPKIQNLSAETSRESRDHGWQAVQDAIFRWPSQANGIEVPRKTLVPARKNTMFQKKNHNNGFAPCGLVEVPLSFRLLAETNSGWLSFPTRQTSRCDENKSELKLDTNRQTRLHCWARRNECQRDERLEKVVRRAKYKLSQFDL